MLDPHTNNAPITAILDSARPWIHGAKLAGAGGGGFLLLMARDPEAAAALRAGLNREAGQKSAFMPYRIAQEGLRIQSSGK